MGFFEFIIGITVIGTVGGIVQGGMKLERQRLRARALSASAQEQQGGLLADMQAEISRLRERVNVLERLVTDDDRRLSNEIDRLRRDDRPGL